MQDIYLESIIGSYMRGQYKMTPEQAKTLAKIEQKLDDLCVNNTRDHKQINDRLNIQDGEHTTRNIECQKMFDVRPKMNLFLWFMAGIFLCIFTIGGFVYHIDVKIGDHIEVARTAYHQLTGNEFVRPSQD